MGHVTAALAISVLEALMNGQSLVSPLAMDKESSRRQSTLSGLIVLDFPHRKVNHHLLCVLHA